MVRLGMPESSPLYPQLPYHYEEYRRVAIYCIAEGKAIQDLLPEPLEPTSDVIEVFVMRATRVTGLDPYDEGGIVVPCRFNGTQGAHVAYEYVSSDDSLCAGREIWGYPKKLADVRMDEYGDRIAGWVMRKNKRIISVSFDRDENVAFEIPNMQPRFQIKKIPCTHGPGFDVANVIMNNFESNVKRTALGSGAVAFEPSEYDPLYRLGPKEILGGVFTVGEFWLGYGEVVRSL